jgi:hypothetical protein
MWRFGRKPPEQDPDPVRNPLAGTRHEEGNWLIGNSPMSREAHRRVMNPPKPPTRREVRRARRAIAPWTQSAPAERTPSTSRQTRARRAKSRSPILGGSSRGKRSSSSRGILSGGRGPLSSRGGSRSGGKRRSGMPRGKKIR